MAAWGAVVLAWAMPARGVEALVLGLLMPTDWLQGGSQAAGCQQLACAAVPTYSLLCLHAAGPWCTSAHDQGTDVACTPRCRQHATPCTLTKLCAPLCMSQRF